MSVLNKKPFIKTLLESMATEDLKTLLSLMDGNGDRTPILRTLNKVPGNGRSRFSDVDLGVHMCSLQIGYTLYNGYFIMNSEYSVLLQFTDFQRIQMFKIDIAKNGYFIVDEFLDINELRSELDDTNQLEGLDIVGNQATTTIVRDALTNINGRVLSSYEAELHEGNPEVLTDYTYYTITYGGEQLTEEQAKNYMEYMTGSRFLPVYNYEKPQNSLFTMADGSIWKPQYMAEGQFAGLRLFKMSSGAGGLPEATAADKVLVSNNELEFEERDAVPLADNLVSEPVSNDTMYSAGPTGGLADISTGEESYLREVKGYSIVWNQLLDADHSHTCVSGHYYIYYSGSAFSLIGPNSTSTYSASSIYKLFDLTLMFGSNDKIPFSLSISTEYVANGTIPAQIYYAYYGFQRLFANVDLVNAPYDAGTIKNVKATKLVESGQNLWDASTMEGTGLKLLAGYRYEIYVTASSSTNSLYNRMFISYDGGITWSWVEPGKCQRADNKWIWCLSVTRNAIIKSYNTTNNPIKYVGFVHSGNYCLTVGTLSPNYVCLTNADIPAYVKHEYDISGINGLNGIPDSSENHCSVYDTKDIKRVESVDLSTLTWTAGEGTFSAEISDIKADTTQLLATQYLGSEMSVSGTTITITASASPTGTLLYELATEVSTGADPFEPISIEVNDMGMEYFEGLDICPVNQLSQYYENLKDKLVNLKEPIEVQSLTYNASSQPILGIKIGNNNYRMAPLIVNSSSRTMVIKTNLETGTSAYSQVYDGVVITSSQGGYIKESGYSYPSCFVVIGSNSHVYYNGTAVGYDALVVGNGAIGIGYLTKNATSQSVTFDGYSVSNGVYTPYNRTYHLFNPENIFFRNERTKTNGYRSVPFTSYTLGHYLNEYICNNALTLQDGKYYVSYTDASNYKTFTSNVISGTATDITSTITGVHITVILTDNDTTPTWHSVVGMDLMLYDSTNSLPYNSYARIDCGGTIEDITAYIDADGCVVITAPTGTVISSVKYNIK